MMERADVVLVYPQRAPVQGRHWIMPSLGLMYLSASLRRAGYSVRHIDHTFLERHEVLEEIDALWTAVELLSTDLKMALLLRDVVGLSYTEIADSLEITLATVKWRIYKAREEVQLALGREGISFGAERATASAESS